MKEYKREYPLFSLCGLNCGLCPRHNTEGMSKCPGCGGMDFHLKHPTCAVITCSRKHDNVEYCFNCSSYQCPRYSAQKESDSFISYKNVVEDFRKARTDGIEKYKEVLNEKIGILEFLINNYNDGKRKNFYCNAVNLLELEDLRALVAELEAPAGSSSNDATVDQGSLSAKKESAERAVSLIEAKAAEAGVDLKLRK